jgi:hypothetical protein
MAYFKKAGEGIENMVRVLERHGRLEGAPSGWLTVNRPVYVRTNLVGTRYGWSEL